MSDKKDAAEPKKKKGGGWLGLVVGLALASAFLLPTELLILIGMVPTIVMAITDPSPDHRGAIAVGVPNLAGIIPFIIELWHKGGGLGHSAAPAIAILSQPVTLLIILASAGMGASIYIFVPRAVGTFTTLRAHSEIRARRALQKKLEAEWGSEIAARPTKK